MTDQLFSIRNNTTMRLSADSVSKALSGKFTGVTFDVLEGNRAEGAVAVTTILPWRIKYRGDTTIAAFDHYPAEDEVFGSLTALQGMAGHADDTLSDLSITHDQEAI